MLLRVECQYHTTACLFMWRKSLADPRSKLRRTRLANRKIGTAFNISVQREMRHGIDRPDFVRGNAGLG
jgi:hypothetical protein